MNWLNLKTSQLREPAFIGSEPVARAAWLCVMAYCVELENGGRIVGARAWKDRQWQQTCGVMLSEVESATSLLTWQGNDLIVWNYPTEKEVEVRDKRAIAQQNGKRGGRPKGELTEKKTNEEPTSVSENNQRPKAEGEREGKEKGKEGEGEPPPTQAPASPSGRREKDDRPTTPEAIAIARLFHRRLDTHWSEKEIAAFRDGMKRGLITVDAIEEIRPYYEIERAKGNGDNGGRHRRDLKTFLNNFGGELDRARAACPKSADANTDPAGWADWLKSKGQPYEPFQFTKDFWKSDFHKDRKAK